MYLCRDAGGGARVAKLLAQRHYPSDLHSQLTARGLAPELLDVQPYPGGFMLVESEYLDPREGWVAVGGMKIKTKKTTS